MLKDTKPHRSKRVLSLDRWNGWALGINMSSNTSTKSKKVEVSKLRNTLNLKEILLLTWYILGLEQMPFRRGVFFPKLLQAISKLCISVGASSIVYKNKRSLPKSNEWWNACSSLQTMAISRNKWYKPMKNLKTTQTVQTRPRSASLLYARKRHT